MTNVEWARLKAHELRAMAEQDAVVIQPVAAIEQHGPHLPVMVDARLAGEVGRRAAVKATGGDTPTLVLPVIPYGLSEHHMPFGGTITLDTPTFHMVIRGAIHSVIRHGFRKVLILNGHGGNILAIQTTAQDLTMEFRVPIVATTYWLEAAPRFARILDAQDNVLHACEAETSMMMVLEPDLVEPDLSDTKGPDTLHFLKAGESAYRWRSLAEVTPNGVIGDPTAATVDKGERLLEAAGEAIAELVSAPATFASPDDLRPAAIRGIPFRKA